MSLSEQSPMKLTMLYVSLLFISTVDAIPREGEAMTELPATKEEVAKEQMLLRNLMLRVPFKDRIHAAVSVICEVVDASAHNAAEAVGLLELAKTRVLTEEDDEDEQED